jgi:hypothetical protein
LRERKSFLKKLSKENTSVLAVGWPWHEKKFSNSLLLQKQFLETALFEQRLLYQKPSIKMVSQVL